MQAYSITLKNSSLAMQYHVTLNKDHDFVQLSPDCIRNRLLQPQKLLKQTYETAFTTKKECGFYMMPFPLMPVQSCLYGFRGIILIAKYCFHLMSKL